MRPRRWPRSPVFPHAAASEPSAHGRTEWHAGTYRSRKIAAKAGVSFQTASKVLNGGNVRVSAETAARIMAVAEQLGYRPNTVARSLVQRTTATIGLIAGDLTDGALSQFAVAAERTARRHQHAVLVGNLAERRRGRRGRAPDADRAAGGRHHRRRAAARGDPAVADLLRRYVPAVSLHHVPGGGVPRGGVQPSRRRAAGHPAPARPRPHGSARSPARSAGMWCARGCTGMRTRCARPGIEPGEDLAVEADWTPGAAARRPPGCCSSATRR